MVQEAYLRAFRFRRGFRGGDAGPWLLRIVRNVFYDSVRRSRGLATTDFEPMFCDEACWKNPESVLLEKTQRQLLLRALDEMPAECRGILLLREIEGLTYKQISDVLEIPTGTVMSRLSRARDKLRQGLKRTAGQERISDDQATSDAE